MELRSTREMRRNEQLAKTTAKKADAAPGQPQARPVRKQTADKCTLSRQALAFFEEQNRLRQARERQAEAEQSKSGKLDLLKEGLDVLDKCLKIAASIRRGDKVPPEDLEYLQNNDPAGYVMALAQRHEKKNPEEVESVLDKEGGEEQSGGEAPAVSALEAPSGGGEASAAQ